MAKAQKQLGIPGNYVNSYYYRQNTPIYNSIMSIKYLIGIENKNEAYNLFKTINYYDVYENKYYLPPIFGVSRDIKNFKNNNINPFLNQQDFVKLSTDINDIFNKLDITYDEAQNNYKYANDFVINLNQENITSTSLYIFMYTTII